MAQLEVVVDRGSDYPRVAPDRFTPTREQANELDSNIRNGAWGHTPCDFIKWFGDLWRTGDPSGWGEEVFTDDAVMLDPVGRTVGAKAAAADFELLFRYFPDLRADVLSWARNDREILINWRFRVRHDMTCPVVDKFSFRNGRVSFRQAYFDPAMLLAYLARHYGAAPFIDYYQHRFAAKLAGREELFLPRIVKWLIAGFFLWAPQPLPPPEDVTAEVINGAVRLEWEPVEGALSYRIRRAERGRAFRWVGDGYVQGTSYVDYEVGRGKTYTYVISSNRLAEEPPPPSYAARPQLTIRR